MRMFGSSTVTAVVLLSHIHANAQDASQVHRQKWELFGELAHLQEYQSRLINASTALSERASSLTLAAQAAAREWDDLKLSVDKVRAENASLQKALDGYNARCAGTIDKKFVNQCDNKKAGLIAWRSAVAGRFQKVRAEVEAKGVEMESITIKLKEVETAMEKTTAELRSVKSAMQTVQQIIDKSRIDEDRSNGPSTNAVHAAHASACPSELVAPPSLPLESFPGMRSPRWAPKRIFIRDCIVTKPNGQTVLHKEGQEQTPMMRLKGGWDGSDEAEEDEVTLGGKG